MSVGEDAEAFYKEPCEQSENCEPYLWLSEPGHRNASFEMEVVMESHSGLQSQGVPWMWHLSY